MDYVVVDIESVGLKPGFHEITEIAILNVKTMELAEWDIKIRHPERCSQEALLITNKTPQQLISRGKYIEDCIDDIDAFIKAVSKDPDEIVCVGHNSSFDRRFLELCWKNLNHTWLANYWLDTMAMSKKFTRQILGIQKTSHALSNMVKLAEIQETPGAHDSITDVINTFKLYNFFIQRGMKNSEFIHLSPALMENLVLKPTKTVKKQKINDADIKDVFGSMDNSIIDTDEEDNDD